MKYRYALISVFDKSGIISTAIELKKLGYRLITTSGTYNYLKSEGIKSINITEFTGAEEILGGRVKTLHPSVFGGILADRSSPEHLQEIKKFNIKKIDIVMVNLYPFERNFKEQLPENETIELIDIGGVSLIRAAAKNYKHVIVISSPSQYREMIKRIKDCKVTEQYRKKLAADAFKKTFMYDFDIANYFNGIKLNKNMFDIQSQTDLSYGENPEFKSSVFILKNSNKIKKLSGKPVSYNNVIDINAAINIINSVNTDKFFSVILKHTNPCGAALSSSMSGAFKNALSCDTQSPYGGIVGFNRNLDIKTAKLIVKTFFELITAPGFNKDAADFIKKKKPNLRLISFKKDVKNKKFEQIRSTKLGLLYQEKKEVVFDKNKCTVVTKKKPGKDTWQAMKLAWMICAKVKSNAVVISRSNKTIGIGAGQMSRVNAVEIAVKNAVKFGHNLKNSAAASDGFFPFKDSIDYLNKYGIKSVIQPGGSIRDTEVIEACDKYGISMVFTGERTFLH